MNQRCISEAGSQAMTQVMPDWLRPLFEIESNKLTPGVQGVPRLPGATAALPRPASAVQLHVHDQGDARRGRQ
jgi:hypothetical protein